MHLRAELRPQGLLSLNKDDNDDSGSVEVACCRVPELAGSQSPVLLPPPRSRVSPGLKLRKILRIFRGIHCTAHQLSSSNRPLSCLQSIHPALSCLSTLCTPGIRPPVPSMQTNGGHPASHCPTCLIDKISAVSHDDLKQHNQGMCNYVLRQTMASCVCLFICLECLAGCAPARETEITNVVLISIDTCRPDYLGCYGYRKNTTPNIDRIASQALLFENVMSPVPITLPAHCSMFTGTIPPRHGVHSNTNSYLTDTNTTLAEILRDNGYQTAAFVGAFVLNSQFGIAQGFNTYNDTFERSLRSLTNVERRGDEVSRLACEWLDAHGQDNFFLFLHYYDPHLIYDPPEPFAGRFSDSLYAGEIAYTDECIGTVISKLIQLGLYDSSLIVITADHGEGLGEHAESSHGYFVYQSTLKVPLLIKIPGLKETGIVKANASLIDIAPTILSFLDIAIPVFVQGRDLSTLVLRSNGLDEDQSTFCESLTPCTLDACPLYGVVTREFKYIIGRRPELYNLVNDPKELDDIAAERPDVVSKLQKELNKILAKNSHAENIEQNNHTVDLESLRSLQALGYVGSFSDKAFEREQCQVDPRDLIQLYERLQDVLRLSFEEDYVNAREICATILKEEPNIPDIRLIMGNPCFKMGNLEEACRHYSEAVNISPDFALAHYSLGHVYLERRMLDKAVEHFGEALRIDPNYVEAHNNVGFAHSQCGNWDKAIYHYNEALKRNPEYVNAYNNLGHALAQKGRFEEAINVFSKALEIDPGFVSARHNRELALKARGISRSVSEGTDK